MKIQNSAIWSLLVLTTLLVGCSPSPIDYRLADGKEVFVSRVGPCNEEYICVFEKSAGEVDHEVEYAILDPSAGTNAKRPDLEVLKQLTNIARDNVGKTIRLGLSPTGTVIVGIEELEGQRRFVQGVELDWSAPVDESDKSRYGELREMFKRNDESRAAGGSPREMTPTADYCSRATSLSQGFAEMVAKRLQVSVDSVRLIRAEPQRVSGCIITLDTPVGPQSCQGGTVYSDGREYWIGGYCS